MRPRAAKIPGIRNHGESTRSLHFSSRVSKWLEDDNLVKRGRATDWKRQYRLRHNWSQGNCKISQTRVTDRQSVPPLIVRFHDAILVTVDSMTGLRAWSVEGENRVLATMALPCHSGGITRTPTALAIDTSSTGSGIIRIATGFSDGALSIYHFVIAKQSFLHRHASIPSSHSAVEAIAYSCPYLLTMTGTKLLSLYHLDLNPESEERSDERPAPRLLSSLKSNTAWPPFSLAIRSSSTNIFASITYAMPTFLAGWSVGLQELRLTSDGGILESRLTSAASQGFTLFSDSQLQSSPLTRNLPLRSQPIWESGTFSTKPTSLSYTHPYVLAAHPDNTLTFYVVTSDSNRLSIGPGYRLWGHTSSVSGAYVGDRGKAVSVSRHGNDLRVWELESRLCRGSSKRPPADSGKSVRIRHEERVTQQICDSTDDVHSKTNHTPRHASSQESCKEEFAVKNGWVAFDDEKVLVLEEEGQGAQMIVVYNFS